MTLDDLRVFNAVAEAGNLSIVARQLRRTQSAVSQHISKLEREIGAVLLSRSTRGTTLTPAGSTLHIAASKGLAEVSMALAEIRSSAEKGRRQLSISTGGTTVRHFLKDAVVRFKRVHPEVTLHFESASASQLCLELLSRGKADLAFVTIDESKSDFEQKPVLEMPLLLLVRRDSEFTARRRLSVRDLRTLRYISLSPATTHSRMVREVMARNGITPSLVATVDDFDTANAFVELGLGEAIVPVVHGRHFERSGPVKCLNVHGLPRVQVGWAARNFRSLPVAAVEFMEMFSDAVHRWKRAPGVRLMA